MLREFTATLQKGENKGAWTCVKMADSVVVRIDERLS